MIGRRRDEISVALRFVRKLRPFLRNPRVVGDPPSELPRRLRRRAQAFLDLLRRGVFAHQHSPYRLLFERAGIGLPDVETMALDLGLESMLHHLYQAGVHVTLDEFKGRVPIRRHGLELRVRAADFDSPLRSGHYEAQTGGSRGRGTRILVDLDLLAIEAEHLSLLYTAHGVTSRPAGLWLPVPPGSAGLKNALRHARLGWPIERWFSQTRASARLGGLKFLLFTGLAVGGSRLWGRPLPAPVHVPPFRAVRVARWLAGQARAGRPALLVTYASSAVRACIAAEELGADIRGTFFRVTGEPLTPQKLHVIERAGCRIVGTYSMAEAGLLGLPCASPVAPDEVHLLDDKMATIQPRKGSDGRGGPGALLHTTLLPSSPRIMINVESGDHGVRERRSCGCLLDDIGLGDHLHTIRSHEKLTSEGVCFLGGALLEIVEEVLPSACGGHPTDYQLVETEEGGLPRIEVRVGGHAASTEPGRIVETILAALERQGAAGAMMAEQWREAATLRVVASEPHVTAAGKILPLHVTPRRGDPPAPQ